MSQVVVEVGPRTLRGPNSVPEEWVSVAIECIDDQIALLDERLVEVRRLWSDLLEVAAGERVEILVLVFPSWWAAARVELVTDAASGYAADVIVLQRVSALDADSSAAVVEFSEEFVVIAGPDAAVEVLPRDDRDLGAYLSAATEVLIDVPAQVSPPLPAFTARLRKDGIAWVFSDRRAILRAVSATVCDLTAPAGAGAAASARRRVAAVLGGAALTFAALGAGWAAQVLSDQPAADPATALLVEGRVGLRVPAQWAVERITSGPGSARLRVSAHSGDPTAIHVTQSTGAPSTTMAEVAESLRRAIEAEPSGVFADFNPTGSVAGRPAVTYRELRPGSETTWAVVIDGAIRIAVGCQHPAAHPESIRHACGYAVRTAHAVR